MVSVVVSISLYPYRINNVLIVLGFFFHGYSRLIKQVIIHATHQICNLMIFFSCADVSERWTALPPLPLHVSLHAIISVSLSPLSCSVHEFNGCSQGCVQSYCNERYPNPPTIRHVVNTVHRPMYGDQGSYHLIFNSDKH